MRTEQDTLTTAPNRLPPKQGEVIDRNTTIRFTFNGVEYTAHPGDTVASALTAAGVKVLSRSFKYHRPRGLLCCSGHCPNCLVQIGDEPNVRACTRPVEAGMDVRAQNVWPSLNRDLLSLTQLGSRFMPVGFYYKTFIRPQKLWPLYEHTLRHAAGLGEVDIDTPLGNFDKQYLHTDVVVVGGGPAGISAALSAAEAGAQVLLFDENPALGGHLRFTVPLESSSTTSRSEDPDESGQAFKDLPELLEAVDRQPNVAIFNDTSVLGWYQDNWLCAVKRARLFKIRTKSVVVATGAYETPLIFDSNDLPGVMLGSAVQRLLHLFGVLPGRQVVVVTANEDGWDVAADLHSLGVNVAAIVDERDPNACTSPYRDGLTSAGVPVFYRHTILEALGSNAVRGAKIARLDERGEISPTTAQSLQCDLIVTSMGWTPATELSYMAGGKSEYNEDRAEILPVSTPPGIYVVGRAVGTHTVDSQIAEGQQAGSNAAAFTGFGEFDESTVQSSGAAEQRRTSERVCVPGKKKRFVCYCEDVTDEDVETAIAEGYDTIELLKRYSTISMGPCQGAMCSMNTIQLCARANGWTVQETGTTTARPPTTPVTLGALAGQNMEPVQTTPIHQWHLDHGAEMMVAGLWLRPNHYGDPAAEAMAVRERVGLIDVSPLGKLQLTGPGVPELLERIYTNQWHNLRVGRVRYGVMCNDEGVVLNDGVCAHLQDETWYMTTTSTGATTVFEWLQWWLQSGWREGIHLTDLTDTYSAFNLAGPQSRAVLEKLTDRNLTNRAFPYMRLRSIKIADVPCRLLRLGFTGELSYEVHCPSGYALHVWEALMEAGSEFDIAPFGVEAQRILRLEKAHIIVGQDTDAMSDPLSANMAWAVKLDKPDFLGKPSLMRISAEGPKQRLVGFKMIEPDVVPNEGLQIVESGADGQLKIVGWVTSSRFSPTLEEAIGLCWLRTDIASQNGAPFTIRIDGQLKEARVHHGAFYDPDGERLRM
ncbi:FAD-dependent oxidoreductase [Candidatus Poribacteria bacterium]|nr:FAD-dependent oxidoreductase [Candidatus Poribacteria bacterium]